MIAVSYEINVVFRKIIFVLLSFAHRICVKKLPFIFKQTLLLSMSGCERTIILFLVLVWLEWCFLLKSQFTLIEPLLLPVQVLSLLHRQSLLDTKRRESLRTHYAVSLVLKKLVRLSESLRLVSKLLSVILFLICSKHVTILLIICQFILSV